MVVPQTIIQKIHNYCLLTFSRFTGSLNAESMTSLVGTIFHFGMISSTCVRRVITTGCGFTFSDICSFADNPRLSNQATSKFMAVQYDTAPCTLALQGRHRPRRLDPSYAAVESRLLPWTHHTGTGFYFCNPQWLQKSFKIHMKFSKLQKMCDAELSYY